MKRTRVRWRPLAVALVAFGVLAILARPAGAGAADQPTTTVVASHKTWTDTLVTVHKGDEVTINAGGTMKVGADRELTNMAPAGIPWGKACSSAVGSRSWPVPGVACWSLIGRIGTGKPFEIGRARTLTAPADGRLALGVNDDYLGDNGGSWRAVVTVEPVDGGPGSGGSGMLPLVAGVLILALVLALVLFFLRRRKKREPDASDAAPIVLATSEVPTGAPLDPTDIDVNIFDVGFPNRSTLRVGYNFFPEGTIVYFRVVDLDVDVRGQFTTEGGGSTRHFTECPLSSPLGEDRDGAEVHFNWTIGAVPFAYTVASRVTRL